MPRPHNPLPPLIAMLALLVGGASVSVEAGPLPPSLRIESLCHSWTESPCLLRVGGSLRSARTGGPLAGKRLRFVAGDTLICASVTDQSGYASCAGVVSNGRDVARSGYRILFDAQGRFTAGSAGSGPVLGSAAGRRL